jgi:hypothetical protein
MKTITLLTLTLLTLGQAAHADSIPNGSYQGKGLWKSGATRGDYSVTTTVRDAAVTSTYQFAIGETRKVELELRADAHGFLRVLSDGKEVGTGYCIERVALCHYEMKTAKLSLEETLTIQAGKLYKFGSKTEGGVTVMWQEALGN